MTRPKKIAIHLEYLRISASLTSESTRECTVPTVDDSAVPGCSLRELHAGGDPEVWSSRG